MDSMHHYQRILKHSIISPLNSPSTLPIATENLVLISPQKDINATQLGFMLVSLFGLGLLFLSELGCYKKIRHLF